MLFFPKNNNYSATKNEYIFTKNAVQEYEQ